LTVLHACHVPTLGGELYVDQWMLEDWQREARSDLEKQLGSWSAAHPTVAVGVDVPCLRPADALVRASAGSDLLAVRRRSQGLAHLGSVVGAAVRESLCPVLVVTPQSRPPETRAGQERDRRLARPSGGL
jgi:nucleotide-binding universal stress UspA family protein